MQADIERMNQQLAERTDYDSEEYQKLIDRFTHENERFLMMGGTNYRAEIERTFRDWDSVVRTSTVLRANFPELAYAYRTCQVIAAPSGCTVAGRANEPP